MLAVAHHSRLCVTFVTWFFMRAQISSATAPQIEPMKPLNNVEMGQRVTILCAINRGTPPISFSWRKDGVPIGQGPDLKIQHNDDFQETLQISKVSLRHVGNYTCAAKNSYGLDQVNVAVVPKFKPVWNTTDASNVVLGVVGHVAVVDCSANGQPTPSISVFKGMLRALDDASVENNCVLSSVRLRSALFRRRSNLQLTVTCPIRMACRQTRADAVKTYHHE